MESAHTVVPAVSGTGVRRADREVYIGGTFPMSRLLAMVAILLSTHVAFCSEVPVGATGATGGGSIPTGEALPPPATEPVAPTGPEGPEAATGEKGPKASTGLPAPAPVAGEAGDEGETGEEGEVELTPEGVDWRPISKLGREPRVVFLEDGSAKELVPENPKRGRKKEPGYEPTYKEVVYPPPPVFDPAIPNMTDPVTGTPCEGYGNVTRGGEGRPEIRVTNRGSGPGSLGDALAKAGNEGAYITFDVSGTIGAEKSWRANNVTIAGETSPGGITIAGGEPSIKGNDVIIRHLRFRGGRFFIGGGKRILVDHCSSTAGGIWINAGSELTVSWCIIAGTIEAMRAHGIATSVHHNFFIHNNRRNPKVMGPGAIWWDYRNNVITQWHNYGMRVEGFSCGNIVNNWFGPTAVAIKPAYGIMQNHGAQDWYVAGNFCDYLKVNSVNTREKPYPEPAVTTAPGEEVFELVRSKVGARPLDGLDAGYLDGTIDDTLEDR